MKIIKQIGIIFAICWISTVIEALLPFSFPASVIGMILLLLCLITGVLKIHHIQEKSDFLLSNMAFFFIPAGSLCGSHGLSLRGMEGIQVDLFPGLASGSRKGHSGCQRRKQNVLFSHL